MGGYVRWLLASVYEIAQLVAFLTMIYKNKLRAIYLTSFFLSFLRGVIGYLDELF